MRFRVIGLFPKRKSNSRIINASSKEEARKMARKWVKKRNFTAYKMDNLN